MTLIKVRGNLQTPAEQALIAPTQTGHKRLAEFGKRVNWADLSKARPKREIVVPGLSLPEIRSRFGPKADPVPTAIMATFQVPLGVTQAQYEDFRNRATALFLKVMEKQGLEFWPEGRIQVAPGMYPAVELHTGVPILDKREFQLRAYFYSRKPRTIEVDVPESVTQPTILRN